MLEKLLIEDSSEIFKILNLDYLNNLYLINYLSWWPEDQQNISFWGVRQNNSLEAVLVETPGHTSIYVKEKKLIKEVAIEKPHIQSRYILGKKDFHEGFLEYFPLYSCDDYLLCKLNPNRLPSIKRKLSYKASEKDLEDLIHFYEHNDFMSAAAIRLPKIVEQGAVYLVRRQGVIGAAAMTTVITPNKVMVGSIYTKPSFRGEGFAYNCLKQLCYDQLSEGKEVYLFYEQKDQVLERFYQDKMGFEPVEAWVLGERRG